MVINDYPPSKAHLRDHLQVKTLCGKTKRMTRWDRRTMYKKYFNKPPLAPDPRVQCKTCVRSFERRVAEGIYEG